jgi:hypothetical protein
MLSVSDADRRQDKEQTLCGMLALVGDQYFVHVSVRPSAKEFEAVARARRQRERRWFTEGPKLTTGGPASWSAR